MIEPADISILIRTVKKNIELWKDSDWKKELIDISPPVLWFGNIMSPRRKILTIGANPSMREFLESKKNQSPLKGPRLFTVENRECLDRLEKDKDSCHKIIDGYNQYFERHPYTQWFGKPCGHKLEALVNGMGGSFYKRCNNIKKCTAIHSDLFPFATLSSFGSSTIKNIATRDLFETKWANETLEGIVQMIRPVAIIVQGKVNSEQYYERFGNATGRLVWKDYYCNDKKISSYHLTESYEGIPTAFVSLNVGNPYGANTGNLNCLGSFLAKELNLTGKC